MSSLENQGISQFISEIDEMRLGRTAIGPSPQKLLMLLAVLELADRGKLPHNRIELDEALISIYEEYFFLVNTEYEWCQPTQPFFYLRSSPFWNHSVKPGKEEAYRRLRKPGAGRKRIDAVVEFAYLSDYAYSVVRDDELRCELKRYLISKINLYTRIAPMILFSRSAIVSEIRLKTVFHESFSLSRSQISEVLSVIQGVHSGRLQPEDSFKNTLREHTALGTRQVISAPRYAFGTGLVESSYELTSFGSAAVHNDSLLERLATQWLMHYFLSTINGVGPIFWHNLVAKYFLSGTIFSRDEIIEDIGEIFIGNEGRNLAEDSSKTTASIFVNCYKNEDALGNLGILRSENGLSDRVQSPEPPPLWAFAYALVHYWKSVFGESRLTVNLDDLTARGGLGSIFLMGGGRMGSYLQRLQRHGVVDIFMVSPPYQVVLRETDEQAILERLYDDDDDF